MNAHEKLARNGFILKKGNEKHVVTAREFSHDDGQHAGLFMGGLGTMVFSRDFDGYFSRWHLEPGIHINHKMQEACFLLSWKCKDKDSKKGKTCTKCIDKGKKCTNCKKKKKVKNNALLSGSIELNASALEQGFKREVTALFPCMWETYSHKKLPFKVRLQSYSAFIPHDVKTSSLPLAFFEAEVEFDKNIDRLEEKNWEISLAFFFPNLLGWRNGFRTPVERTKTPFPAQSHAGNTGIGLECSGKSDEDSLFLCQKRKTAAKDTKAEKALEGEIALFVTSKKENKARLTREICFKAGQNRIGIAEENQKHTIAWAKAECSKNLALPMTELSWQAHWDEALGSALCSTIEMEYGKNDKKSQTFALIMDCPITEFGKGRKWLTKYTEYFGTSGNNSAQIAEYALENYTSWKNKIFTWHKEYIEKSCLPIEIAQTQINELYFLLAGGTAYVSKMYSPESFTLPSLGDKEHFGILEGFDVGYHYYNTTDLWVYAFSALSRHFPSIAQSVFEDILQTVPLELSEKHMIYREAEMQPILVKGKIPHDMGSAPSDVWHDLNGYQMRDDSNKWLDHVPTSLVSYYVHCKKTGYKLDEKMYKQIEEAFYFMLEQQDEDYLPQHRAFGDSTWDNLGLKGFCTYTATAVIACYHVMQEWAKDFEDKDLLAITEIALEKAYKKFHKELWTGEFFRACTIGAYKDCIMADSLMWLMYINMAGIEHKIDKKYIKSHLKAVYAYNYKKHGFHAPLLICEPQRGSFPPDGGDIGLQVNEVLLGSAWTSIALMEFYGLEKEAREIALDMAKYQYKSSSLHFRSPAAWDNLKRFRAPLNMRPLAISLIDWN